MSHCLQLLTTVQTDDMSPSEQTIFASPVQALELSSTDLYKGTSTMDEYRNVVEQVLKHFFDNEVNTTHALHLFPRQEPRLTAILDLAQAVVDFEIKLATITPPEYEEMDITKSYNKLNISALEDLLPQISLPRLVKNLGPPDYTVDSVVASSPKYLSKLHFLLQMTKNEILEGFLVWKTIQQYADRIADPALKPLKDFNTKLKGSRVEQPSDRWRQCVQSAEDDLPWISAWFLMQDSKAEMKTSAATDITNKVKKAFTNAVKKADWMVKEDSEQSASKAQAISQEIGHPKKMDAASLEKYYADLSITKSYFENKISASRFESRRSWSKLGEATVAEWDVTPLSTQPHYDATLNRLLLPEGLLYSPISYKAVPDYFLFGSFGAIGGHGISKSLGPVGSFYDEDGIFADPWTKKTRKAFEKKAQCFIDQYSDFTITGPDGNTHNVDGKLTLNENIADVAGANAAFEAWKEHEKKHSGRILPGLEKYSRDQMFWLGFGNMLCSMTTKAEAVQQIHSSPRAPERARILVSASFHVRNTH